MLYSSMKLQNHLTIKLLMLKINKTNYVDSMSTKVILREREREQKFNYYYYYKDGHTIF